MSEKRQQQSDFMIEKIKDRPVNKRKLLKRTILTASMAVIFGLIACMTFLLIEPIFNSWIYPEEKPLYVEFPEDTVEMLPADMIVEEEKPDIQQEVENVLEEGGQIEEKLSDWVLNKNNYSQLYAAMSEYKDELTRSMVVVKGFLQNTDVFNEAIYNEAQVSGVILADNGIELLILADRTSLLDMDTLTVTFCSNQEVAAYVKQYDTKTNLAVFAVPLKDLTERTSESIKIAELGASNAENMVGMPVVAMGSPMGQTGSVGYGIITAGGKTWSVVDANYNLFLTDIYGSTKANGVLFNYDNKVIGIITNGKNEEGMENMLCAWGISELKKTITRMSNAKPEIYMGVSGVNVNSEIRKVTGVPMGVYVTKVEMDSPAMLAGIQEGDIITKIETTYVSEMSYYTLAILQHNPGDKIVVTLERLVQDEYKEIVLEVTLSEIVSK